MLNNRILFTSLCAATVCFCANSKIAPASSPEVVNPDSTGFKFTEIKTIPTTPVKNQNKSGTCWSFAGVSVLEDDVLREKGETLDLSEMYYVRQNYIDKAKKYVRMGGNINFAQGGSFADVTETAKEFGAIPEEVYSGLEYGEKLHSHYEMADGLKAYLDALVKSDRNLSSAWLKGFTAILDAYLGTPPEQFTYKGKTYTPQSFAKAYGLVPQDYINVTSYTHHPFYTSFALEVPDNWRWAESYNIPMNEMKEIVDYALDKGYTIGWAADVSEPGFKWREGYAVLPAEKTEADMSEAEVEKWAKLSAKERTELANQIKGPVKEKEVTQESRQKAFDNRETTDDHAMTIIGIAEDQEGNRYYKVKNSWDTNQVYDGFLYVSEPYFLEKTLDIHVNKNAVPKNILKKLGL